MIQILLCLSSVLFAYRGKFNSVTNCVKHLMGTKLDGEAVVEGMSASSLLLAVL